MHLIALKPTTFIINIYKLTVEDMLLSRGTSAQLGHIS